MGAHVTLLLAAVVVLVGFFWMMITLSTYNYIAGKFKIQFDPLTGADLETAVQKALSTQPIDMQWLIDRGFEPVGGYRSVSPIKASTDGSIVIWKLAEENTFLFVTLLFITDHAPPPTQIEFHTPLKDGESRPD